MFFEYETRAYNVLLICNYLKWCNIIRCCLFWRSVAWKLYIFLYDNYEEGHQNIGQKRYVF